MSGAEPRWDRDVEYGRQAELRWDGILDSVARKDGRVENKRKRRIDLDFYVETHCDKGRTGRYEPSAMSLTQADIWIYDLADTGLSFVFPTTLLREAMTHPTSRLAQEHDGSCPTKGILVNLAAILQIARRQHDGERGAEDFSPPPYR